MTVAELMVKISADIGSLQRGVFESKLAIADLQRSVDNRNSSGGRRGFLGQITNFLSGLPGLAQQANRWFEQMFSSAGQWMQGLGGGLPVISQFGSLVSMLAPALALVTTGLIAVGAAAGVVFVGLTVLLTVWNLFIMAVGALAATVVTFLGPLGVLVAAFAALTLGATQVWGVLNNKHIPMFHHLQAVLGALDSQFGVLIRRLANDFLPIITTIADALRPFVYYLEQVVRMPLSDALHSLATRGVSEFNHLLGIVTHALANPVRMIIDFAFGQGGDALNNEIAGLYHRFSNFVFQGPRWVEQGKGPAGARGGGVRIMQGASPWDVFKHWFDQQHIMDLGKRIGDGLMNGIETAAGAAKFGRWLNTAFIAAVKQALLLTVGLFVGAFLEIFVLIAKGWMMLVKGYMAASKDIRRYLKEAFDYVLGVAVEAWHAIARVGEDAWRGVGIFIHTQFGPLWHWLTTSVVAWAKDAYTWITSQIGAAFSWVKSKIQDFWNWLTGLFSKVLTIHVSIPGLSTIEHVLGAAGGAASSAWNAIAKPLASGGIVTRPTLALIGEAGPEAVVPLNRLGAAGGGVVHVHLHNPLILGDRTTARATARWLAPLLKQQVFG